MNFNLMPSNLKIQLQTTKLKTKKEANPEYFIIFTLLCRYANDLCELKKNILENFIRFDYI